jgi:hypothetical protein
MLNKKIVRLYSLKNVFYNNKVDKSGSDKDLDLI